MRKSQAPAFVRWPIWIATRLVLPLCLLLAIGGGMLYVRLLNGPISLKPLAAPIARAIAADLPGLGVTIEDASAMIAEGTGLEFRLRNVRFTDTAGTTVALAPDAAVMLSQAALWTGSIVPSRIVLIEPRLILQYSREQGLSFSIARGSEASASTGAPNPAPSGTPGTGAAPQPISDTATPANLSRLVGGLLGQTTNAASYVKGIGLRRASLIVESGGQRTDLRIRDADLNFDRGRLGSTVGAAVTLESARGPWQVNLVATSEDATGAILIDAKLADLFPSAIAGSSPGLAALSVLDLPVNGTAAVKLTQAGDVTSAALTLDLGRGAIVPTWRGAGRAAVDGGRLTFQYRPETRNLVLEPSRLGAGTSWATLAGSIGLPAQSGQAWPIDIVATEGMIAAEEFGIAARPLEAFRVRATFDPATGNFDIAEAAIKALGGEIAITGHVPPRGAVTRTRLQGRMSAMSVEALKLLWPSVVAPAARRWSGTQIQQGRLTSGTFLVEDVGHGVDRGRAGADGIRIAVSLEGTGIRIQPKPGFAPVEAARALVRLEGNVLEVAAPDAVIITGPQRRLPLKAVRLVSNDVTSPTATADLTFRAQGALPPAIDLAEQQAARNGRKLALPGEGMDGRVDAQVRILVPLGEDLTADDTRLDIKGRITDGRVRGAIGGHDVSGATIAVELTDQSLDAKGDMLVAGVAAKISLKRIFAAPDAEQPPIVITATRDTSDRTQLGLDINEFVIGEMPVEIIVSPRAQAEPQVQLRANLTNAELVIEPLAWKKPVGRPATLQFEVVKPSKQRTELQGFRIVGEDIALSGSLVLDGRNRLREFSFPELSLHVVSRLQLAGTLRNDNVWDVTVRGQTLDARDYFQSLFSVNQVRSKPLPPSKDQSGLDLKAEIDTVLGHQEVSLKALRLQVSNRGGRTVAMTARGVVDGMGRDTARPIEVVISQAGRDARRLVARSDDAGQVFRLVGFYPNMHGGRMQLDVNLDGQGNADKTGRLYVERFAVLGDPVAIEPPSALEPGAGQRAQQRRFERPRLDFDSMSAPFELGHGQLVIKDADLRGQVLGVLLRGKADFRTQHVDLGGTYVPLQGLNSALGQFPILGQILAGPRGEGVIGMTFAIQGPMARPQMIVNPASFVPGIFREIMQMTNPDPRVTPRDAPAAAPVPQKAPTKAAPPKTPAARASSTNQPTPRPAAGATTATSQKPRVEPDGGWSSQTVNPPSPQPARKQ